MFGAGFGESSEYQVAHTNRDPGFASTRVGFHIAPGQAAVVAQPGEGALHYPAARQHGEYLRVRRLYV